MLSTAAHDPRGSVGATRCASSRDSNGKEPAVLGLVACQQQLLMPAAVAAAETACCACRCFLRGGMAPSAQRGLRRGRATCSRSPAISHACQVCIVHVCTICTILYTASLIIVPLWCRLAATHLLAILKGQQPWCMYVAKTAHSGDDAPVPGHAFNMHTVA